MAILKEFIEIYLNTNGYFTVGLRITIVVFKYKHSKRTMWFFKRLRITIVVFK